ncbi:MAG: hypothetical protein COB33_004670 [Thiotrichaceae bacterium]|nr:hypothetical protein [Thiotrichaceae bacterium]PCI14977.1 MAG: hypothetical protein COB71_00030 [Thiotrichales bacterium]
MVPGERSISNPEIDLIAKWGSNNKDFSSKLEHKTPLNSDTCEELFNTLAEWNSYLEDHIPYFSEIEAAPEEPQP